jgi:hypothetical protein
MGLIVAHSDISKCLLQGVFSNNVTERIVAAYAAKLEPLFHDCHQHVDADGDPDLRFHCVLGSAVEALDAKVLLDSTELQRVQG